MENKDEAPGDKKYLNKAKSQCGGPPTKFKSPHMKRNSFNVNEAVKSLDLALCRLKKSKLVPGEYSANTTPSSPARHGTVEGMFIDSLTRPSSNFHQGIDNASLMSMNFSHYELIRNVSHSNCNSDGAFSGSTCSAYLSPTDLTVKDEHLERYFRSVEMWSRNTRDIGPSNVHLEMPEK